MINKTDKRKDLLDPCKVLLEDPGFINDLDFLVETEKSRLYGRRTIKKRRRTIKEMLESLNDFFD